MSVSGPSQNQSRFKQLIQDELYLEERRSIRSEDDSLYIDTGTVLPDEMSNFYSLNFPNLSAVSASECNIQSFTTISSGIAPEAELSVAEDKGVNSSTRDLVLAAISVMKGRKARPDTKRICNWVNRKYGRSVQEVVQEIDDLCQESILEKVDYKGSISFRITSEKKLHKRVGRRKNSSQGRPEVYQSSEEASIKSPRAPSPKKSPKLCSKQRESLSEKMDPVTLNLLLREEMNLLTNGRVSKDHIVQAVELTKRPINKRAVYRDLETILAHEIHLGYLVKLAENNFVISNINKDKHYRGTIPLKSSKRKPKPTQKYLEMEAELQKNKPEKYSEYVSFDAEGNFAFPFPGNGAPNLKSEEELKDELIKEKLISNNLLKMKSKKKSGKAKTKKENGAPSAAPAVEIVPIKTELPSLTLPETTVTLKEERKSVLVPIKPKIKKETWQVSITVKEAKPRLLADFIKEEPLASPMHQVEVKEEPVEDIKLFASLPSDEVKDVKPKRNARKRRAFQDDSDEDELMIELIPPISETTTRTLSGRKKRARKIFDPADHDVPSRIIKKCRTSSPNRSSPAPSSKCAPAEKKVEMVVPPTETGTAPPAQVSLTKTVLQSGHDSGPAETKANSSQMLTAEPVLARRTVFAKKSSIADSSPVRQAQDPEVNEYPAKVKVAPSIKELKKSPMKPKFAPKKKPSEACLPNSPRQPEMAVTQLQAVHHKEEPVKKPEIKMPSKKITKSDIKGSSPGSTSAVKSVAAPSAKAEKSGRVETKAVGPRKTADPVVKNSNESPTNVKTKKEILKKDILDNIANSNITETMIVKQVDDSEKLSKKSDTDPLFKVPAPKKPLSKPVNLDRPSPPKSENAKTKANKPRKTSPTKVWNGPTNKPSKSAARPTRGSTLTVSLRAKKDPKERALCNNCNAGNKKNEKLLFCSGCDKIIHPSCLHNPEELTDLIYKQPWQCFDCKTCFVCLKSGNDDNLLLCDSCDLGYHMTCHRPPIYRKPRGRWECDSCAAETGYKGETDEKFNPPGAATFFEELLPALPPGVSPWPVLGYSGGFCPAPDQYPPNWQDLPVDENIPDISGWSAARMSQYLVQNGIKDTAAKVFFDQEIDGASVLVLQRRDVLQGLGLKLGPALKIYYHIKRLQTRRNFGLVA